MTTTIAREQWGSRFGYLMAVLGAMVGAGNIWRMPYVTEQLRRHKQHKEDLGTLATWECGKILQKDLGRVQKRKPVAGVNPAQISGRAICGLRLIPPTIPENYHLHKASSSIEARYEEL